jgi:dihydrofolate reductase
MRTITVLEHITMDGIIQAPGGPDEDCSGGFTHGGWIGRYSDEVLGTALRQKMHSSFDLLVGRHTFEIWEPYWPNQTFWPEVNAATKYVASNTRTTTTWQPAVFLQGDVAAQVAQLKQQPGRDIHVWGSSDFVQTLLAHDLVDALWLMVYPLTLGTGKRLFGTGTIPVAFQVVESIATPSGAVVMHYVRTRAD